MLAFAMFVAVVPAWTYFVASYGTVSQMSLPSQFLVGLSLPAVVGLALLSWVQPG